MATKKKVKPKPSTGPVRSKGLWRCSVKECDYVNTVERACWRHPGAKLRQDPA